MTSWDKSTNSCNGLQSSAHGLALIGGFGSRSLQLAESVGLTLIATGLNRNSDGLAIINRGLTILATGAAGRRAFIPAGQRRAFVP